MIKKIGIFGSAQGETEEDVKKARVIGEEIMKRGYQIITGATTGLPDKAVKAAQKYRKIDSVIIGYSPYKDEKEHQENLPVNIKDYSEIVYTGQGKKGRNLIAVVNCDAGVFLKGRIGTLNEFTIAYDEGIHCAVLEGMSGTCDLISEIVKIANKRSEAQMFYHSDPKKLIEMLDEYLKNSS